ncbi:MAG: glycosyltransferase family 2 protein [Campylobacterota bacterium]|nr:glycosyltransferase family 2 protein [Campylobacterota bacterium]
MKLSIIIPCLNEERYIAGCIDSILKSDFNKRDMEVIFVDGMSSDNTRSIIKKYQDKYDFIQLINNLKKIVPIAMNLGIRASKGEYIIRLDAHASYPADYFSKLIYYHQKLEADNVGGVLLTEVKNKTNIPSAIKNVLSDKLGVGSSFRSGIDQISEVDTVPFGCYRRDIFERVGYYDERLARNQDIELNNRIKHSGGKIYIIPSIKCTYFAREDFRALAKNNFDNGRWNILTAYYTGKLKSLSLRHYVPMLFLLSILIPLFCCYGVSMVVLVIYLTTVTIRSYQIKKETTLPYQVISFIYLHFSYGFGSLAGLLDILLKYLNQPFIKLQ